MERIVAGITGLEQHLQTIRATPEVYRPAACPHCGIKIVWAHGRYHRMSRPIWFATTHWLNFARPGKQLIIGLLMIAAAVALLYGAGPHFVDRIAAGVK